MKKIRKSPLLLFLILFVALYVMIYIIPRLTGALKPTYTAEYGRLRISDEVDGYIVRNETVYTAGSGGTVNRYIKDGKLVRKGTRIIGVTPGENDAMPLFGDIKSALGSQVKKSDDYAAEEEGVVIYFADGLETSLTPANMGEKDLSFYHDIGEGGEELDREKTAEDDPVFKIVDRSAWYIVCFIPESHKDRYEEGGQVSLSIDGQTPIKGNIQSVAPSGDTVRLIIRTDYYQKDFGRLRKVDLEVITSDTQGIIIQNSSIVKKNGSRGVMVRQKNGRYSFVPVNVLSSDGERSTVSMSYFRDEKGNAIRTVKNYDVILRG